MNKHRRLHAKKQVPAKKRSHKSVSFRYVVAILVAAFLLGSSVGKADNVGRGIFGGAATGALIGGIAGGGRGAGYGALAGAAIGGIAAAASDSDSGSGRNDPYRRLDKEERKLRKLQDRYDRASDRKRPSLERQLQTQNARVADLRARLGIR